jgi:hypothetical protein
MMIKLLLGAVTVAGLIAACGGRGPAADSAPAAPPGKAGSAAKAGLPPGCLVPPATCYTPRVFRAAYGISPLLERGIDGRGQTVVMPEPAQQPGTGGVRGVTVWRAAGCRRTAGSAPGPTSQGG